METGTLAELRHLTRTAVDGRPGRPASTGWPTCPACTTCGSTAPGCAARSTLPRSTRLLRALTAVGVRSLSSQPPTLEELFLRHYAQPQRAGALESRP